MKNWLWKRCSTCSLCSAFSERCAADTAACNHPTHQPCLTYRAQPALEETRLGAVRAVALLAKVSQCAAALREEANAPLLGHTLSLLLEVSHQEAAAGDTGSRTLRGDALCTLCEVVSLVRTPPLAVLAILSLARLMRHDRLETLMRSPFSCPASLAVFAEQFVSRLQTLLGCAFLH